jgi:predicted nucleic acid-binding protein
MNEIALDTNVLIYSHDSSDLRKQAIARTLIDLTPSISTQVISEYINVLRRKMAIPKDELLELCIINFEDCKIHQVEISTLKIAKRLIQQHNFQVFDSIIVASAVEAKCEILYTEDMRHGLLIDGFMKILNPFLVT